MFIQMMVLAFLFSLTLTLPLVSSPLLMGLWVLFIALMLSMWMGMMGMSWFGLILFLIYIGGMLVMFIYFVAITPNQRHEVKVFFVMGTLLISVLLVLMNNLKFIKEFSLSHSFSSSMVLFSISQGTILVTIFIMLFVGLIIVVKITRLSYGPLRPFN